MFTQRVHDCDEHDACHRIDCVTDTDILDEAGAVIHSAVTIVWHSHAHNSTHPECRANNDHRLEDHRGEKPVTLTPVEMCADCQEHFG